MRAALLLVGALLVAPSALAQTTDPTVNDSDFNTTPPNADTSYMNDTNGSANGTADPTVNDSDFDTTPPGADTSYLDEAAREYGVDAANGTTGASASAKTPAPGFALLASAAAGAALLVRGRRRSR